MRFTIVAYKEVRGDIIALSEGIFVFVHPICSDRSVKRDRVTVAEFFQLFCSDDFLQIELLDVVLYSIPCVRELFVERGSRDVVSIFVVFAIADEVDVVFATKKGAVKIDVVYDFVIVLIFEFRRDVGIADEVIYHCFEDDVEVAYDKEVLSVFVGAAVVFEECVK